MAPDDSFDLAKLAEHLAAHPLPERAALVNAELTRVRVITVRDAGKRFTQQKYLQGLERLGRALSGHNVRAELTPSERPIHVMLLGEAPAAVEVAPPPPPAPPPVEAPREPTGAERRISRRIQMKTRVRIRRDSDNVTEIVEPLNLSRGGVGFQSCKRFALHETVWVTMHYQPDSTEMETKSIIVRAAPIASSVDFSYGLKFL